MTAWDASLNETITAGLSSFPDTLHSVFGAVLPAGVALLALVGAWSYVKRWLHV